MSANKTTHTWRETLDKLREAQIAAAKFQGAEAEKEELNRAILKLDRQLAFESFDPLAQITEIPHADLTALHSNIEALKQASASGGGSFNWKSALGGIVGIAKRLILPI